MDKRTRAAASRAGRPRPCVALRVFVRRHALQRRPEPVLGKSVLEPIREQDGGRRADASRDHDAAGARGARSGGDADRFRRPQAAGRRRLGRRLERRRRFAGRGRRRRDARFPFQPLRRTRRRATRRQRPFQRLRSQERDAHGGARLSRCGERRDGQGAEARPGRGRRRSGQVPPKRRKKKRKRTSPRPTSRATAQNLRPGMARSPTPNRGNRRRRKTR